ncbi:MAG: hypothetical protein OXI15_07750 [Chromatiales bacterium]|nr:hypothetical protein [Chromatiales bacterium]
MTSPGAATAAPRARSTSWPASAAESSVVPMPMSRWTVPDSDTVTPRSSWREMPPPSTETPAWYWM